MTVRVFPELDENQRLMLDSVVKVMESTCPLTTVRALANGAQPSDPGLRRKLADVGCYGLLATEEIGGGSISGNGVVDAAVIAAERGARLQPGPFIQTSVVVHVLAGAATNAHSAEVAQSLIAGETAAAWAMVGTGSISIQRRADEWVISGTVPAVQDADECEHLLLTTTPDGCQLLVPLASAGVELVGLERLDVTHRFFDVRLSGVRLPVATKVVRAASSPEAVARQLSIAAVLSAAESVGAMDSDFAMAVEYAKIRIAFGRPIGSFQAVKHRLADVGLIVEMSKGIVAGAARALGSNAPDGDVLASIAKAFVSEHSIDAAHSCFQVFGGIGFTWEHDQHLYLRRLASDAYQHGSPNWHRDRLWSRMTSLGSANV